MTTNNRSVFFPFLLGGLIGAGLALLYAPYSGTETRRKIREGVEDAGDWTKDTLDDARERVTESTGKVKQFVVDKKDDVQAAFQAGKDAFYKGKEKLMKEVI